MLFLGFSSGLPILLVFSTLSVWLFKAGISRSTVTLFSWAGFAYAFKYLWSPIVDNFKIPFLQQMGHRRSWLLLAQVMIVLCLIATSLTDPSQTLVLTAVAITCLAIFSATQDIVIDAYRIESASHRLQGPLSSMYIAGYRTAMLVGGAGSLWLASYLGTEIYDKTVWQIVYLFMAVLMSVGIITTVLSSEPKNKKNNFLKINQHTKFLFVFILSFLGFIMSYNFLLNPFGADEILQKFLFSIFKIFLCFVSSSLIIFIFIKTKFISKEQTKKIYLEPIKNFTNRYGKFAFYILLLISLYRIADVVMGVIANIFYLEKGFNIKEIATYSKFFGVFATILGGFLGGFFSIKFGTMKSLFIGAVVAAGSNLLFAWLALSKINIIFLITVITADNISSGFAGAAFVVYLSGLTSIKFTATQYALFSSIMLFIPKLIAGYAGSWVDFMGYANFFIITALLGVPVLLLIIWIARIAPIKN
jgi:PAT family beta-lactamase induction signal transducer AmpG|tara:strand:- start:4351 stop:5775 length:1425 start_codon:yes stop_codon:yes gene_type:complete